MGFHVSLETIIISQCLVKVLLWSPGNDMIVSGRVEVKLIVAKVITVTLAYITVCPFSSNHSDKVVCERNKTGASTDPCGTTLCLSVASDSALYFTLFFVLVISTRCFLSLR